MSQGKGKYRAEFRKNRFLRTREKDFTRAATDDQADRDAEIRGERITGKGPLTRKRTVVGEPVADGISPLAVLPEIDQATCQSGRILSVHGLVSQVQTDSGAVLRCVTRGLLRTLAIDDRSVVSVGDRVWVRPQGQAEGVIEQVTPRRGVLSRTSRGRQHVLVANVDQIVIVASAGEPPLKPNLIDRMLVTAEKNSIAPLICINKIDLVNAATLLPLVGVYSQLAYRVLLVSARTGQGIDRLRRAMEGRESVVSGQSGVGKSSLLNAVDPTLKLPAREVSRETSKGKHTTTTARLIALRSGGFVVDTPGIRQFQLWDVTAEELAAYFREMRPYVSRCRYPNCAHIDESHCAVKDAVADGLIDSRRYESYIALRHGDG